MDKVPQSKSQTCCSSRESSREEQQYLQDHIRECLLTSLHPQQLLGCFFQAQQGCSTPTQPWDPTGALGKGQDQPPHTKARDAPADTARAGGGSGNTWNEGEKPTAWKCRLKNCQAKQNHVHVANPAPTCFWSDKS